MESKTMKKFVENKCDEDEENKEESKEERAAARRDMLILEGILVPSEPSCIECASSGQYPKVDMDQTGGVYVCTGCGLQLGSQIITEDTEWRSFADDGCDSNKVDPNRVGGPEDDLFSDMGLSTMIDGNSELGNLQNKEALSGIQKTLTNGFRRIEYFSSLMSLTKSTIDHAKHFYKRIENNEFKMKKIRKKDTLIVACIKFACTKMDCPRTFKEISETTNTSVREVKKAYARIKSALSVADREMPNNARTNGVLATSPMQLLIPKISMLKLGIIIERAAGVIIERAIQSNNLGSTTAPAIVGAAIYKATMESQRSGDKRSLADISTVMHVSASTIRSVYNKF